MLACESNVYQRSVEEEPEAAPDHCEKPTPAPSSKGSSKGGAHIPTLMKPGLIRRGHITTLEGSKVQRTRQRSHMAGKPAARSAIWKGAQKPYGVAVATHDHHRGGLHYRMEPYKRSTLGPKVY